MRLNYSSHLPIELLLMNIAKRTRVTTRTLSSEDKSCNVKPKLTPKRLFEYINLRMPRMD